MLHDGYTDQLYALLPVWQSEFGLSYAGVAVLRALYYGTMGGLQVPGDRLLARFSPRLALATLVAAAGFLLMALPLGFAGLCAGLILAGVGSSVQHPRASLLVTQTYGRATRGPLGVYNFAGDFVWSVIATEAATALLTAASLALPLAPMLVVLPLLGIALNGTSSIDAGKLCDQFGDGSSALNFQRDAHDATVPSVR